MAGPACRAAAVPVLRDGLIRSIRAARRRYTANAERYLGELRRLDRTIARCIETIPAAKRKLVTTHDALGAYAHR